MCTAGVSGSGYTPVTRKKGGVKNKAQKTDFQVCMAQCMCVDLPDSVFTVQYSLTYMAPSYTVPLIIQIPF